MIRTKSNKILQRVLKFAFEIVWRRRLFEYSPYSDDRRYGEYMKVVRVKGWRTVLVDSKWRGRMTVTFLFKKSKVGRVDHMLGSSNTSYGDIEQYLLVRLHDTY